MKTIRTCRPVTALIALFCVLFMQFAVAAYACPGMGVARPASAEASAPEHQAMTGCHGMDTRQPTLCHASDQSGNQSLDKPEIPQIQPFVPGQLVASIAFSADMRDALAVPMQEPSLTRATSPPLAVRNCCFRN
jgi:hypothetical protein